MEALRQVVDILVFSAGFVTWLLFVPQIKKLKEVKRSDALSLGTIYGSIALQLLYLLQSGLQENWALFFPLLVSLTCLCILLRTILHYREWPGGR